MLPDMRTVMLIYAITNAVCALFMALMWYFNHKRFAGITFWLIDMILQAIGIILLILRGIIPDFISMTVANIFVVAGILIIYIGLGYFVGKRNSQIHNYILVGVFIAVLVYFTYVTPNLIARTFDISAITLILTFQCAWIMLHRLAPNIRRAAGVVGIVFGGYAFISVVRIILLVLFPFHSNDFFKSAAPDTFIMISYTILTIGLTISLILMINSRLIGDIRLYAQQRDDAANELKENHAILMTAFENSQAGVAIADAPDGKLRYVNNAGLLIRDKSGKDIVEDINIDKYVSSWNILHLDGTPYKPDEVPLAKAVLYGKTSSEEFVIRRDNFEDRIVWANAGPVLDESGSIKAGVVVFLDITERKKIEAALKESEEKFSKAFLTSPYAISITSFKDGKIIEINNSFKSITGFSYEELMSSSVIDLGLWVNKKDREWVLSELKKGVEVRDKEFNFRKKNGEAIIGLFSAQIIHINNEPYILSSIDDITIRKNTEGKILYLSYHDQLTGLYNRRFFEEELKRLDTKRQLPLSVIMGDLNSLKLTNDTFGHNEGDKILKDIAGLLKRICRSDDILARWGGDEFVILLPKTSSRYAEEIVARIKNACKMLNNNKLPLSLAIGISAKTGPGQDIGKIIMQAESNMYKNKLTEKESDGSSIILALEQALYEKSSETMEHAARLKDSAIKLGKSIELDSSQLDELSLLASLHDIGKVAIPETVLLKKDKLTEEDWAAIKRHPEIGFNIAQTSPQIVHIAKYILACHESWDGSGYPKGLMGEDIPIVSRIMFICDAYDVMTSERVYKKAMSSDEAIKEMKRCSGTQFDPVLVKKFIETISGSSGK